MQRREFLQKTAAAAVTVPGVVTLSSAAAAPAQTFKLKYAPHVGMFKASGGGDLFGELRFMAEAGFRALEDNGMMARSIDVQQRIGDALATAGMTMGVFVIDAGDNWKVSLATGKPEFRERFVKACAEAVNVAKR
jgi:hydroxypyruvate isomerase